MSLKLAGVLVTTGQVPAHHVDAALRRQVLAGGSLDLALFEVGATISEARCLKALEEASGLPGADGAMLADARPEAAAMLPATLALRHGVLPLRIGAEGLEVAVSYPPDRRTLDEIGLLLGKPLRPRIALEARLREALARSHGVAIGARYQSVLTLLGAAMRATAGHAPALADPLAGAWPLPTPIPLTLLASASVTAPASTAPRFAVTPPIPLTSFVAPDAAATATPPDAAATATPLDAAATATPPDASATATPLDAAAAATPLDAAATATPLDAAATATPPDAAATATPPDAAATATPHDTATTTIPPDAAANSTPPNAAAAATPPDAATTPASPSSARLDASDASPLTSLAAPAEAAWFASATSDAIVPAEPLIPLESLASARAAARFDKPVSEALPVAEPLVPLESLAAESAAARFDKPVSEALAVADTLVPLESLAEPSATTRQIERDSDEVPGATPAIALTTLAAPSASARDGAPASDAFVPLDLGSTTFETPILLTSIVTKPVSAMPLAVTPPAPAIEPDEGTSVAPVATGAESAALAAVATFSSSLQFAAAPGFAPPPDVGPVVGLIRAPIDPRASPPGTFAASAPEGPAPAESAIAGVHEPERAAAAVDAALATSATGCAEPAGIAGSDGAAPSASEATASSAIAGTDGSAPSASEAPAPSAIAGTDSSAPSAPEASASSAIAGSDGSAPSAPEATASSAIAGSDGSAPSAPEASASSASAGAPGAPGSQSSAVSTEVVGEFAGRTKDAAPSYALAATAGEATAGGLIPSASTARTTADGAATGDDSVPPAADRRGSAAAAESAAATSGPRRAGVRPRNAPRDRVDVEGLALKIARQAGHVLADADPIERLTLEKLQAAFGQAQDRDQLIRAAIRLAVRAFDFAAAFAVVGGNAVGWTAVAHDGPAGERVAGVEIPLHVPSVLRTVILTGGRYLGPLPQDELTQTLRLQLDRREDCTVLVQPIEVRGHPTVLLWCDLAGRAVPESAVSTLVLIAQQLSRRFENLILEQKRRLADATANPPTTAPAEAASATTAPPPMSAADLFARSPNRSRTLQNASSEPALAVCEFAPARPPGVSRSVRGTGSDGPAMDELCAAADLVVGSDPAAAARALATLVRAPDLSAAVLAARFPGPVLHAPWPVERLPAPEQLGPIPAALARLGTSAARVLGPLIEHRDADVRYFAVLTAGSLPSPILEPFVAHRIFDRSDSVASAARVALTAMRELPGFSTTLRRLREGLIDADPEIAARAARALGALRDPEATAALIALVARPEAIAAQAAADALRDICKQAFGPTPAPWAAWWSLNRDRPRLEWLIAGLRHRAPEVRASAIEELVAMADDRFGYYPDAPHAEREAAIQRWDRWRVARATR